MNWQTAFANSVLVAATLLLIPTVCFGHRTAEQTDRSKAPNVLFISVDDLSDWIGCMGVHPQAKNPQPGSVGSQRSFIHQRSVSCTGLVQTLSNSSWWTLDSHRQTKQTVRSFFGRRPDGRRYHSRIDSRLNTVDQNR